LHRGIEVGEHGNGKMEVGRRTRKAGAFGTGLLLPEYEVSPEKCLFSSLAHNCEAKEVRLRKVDEATADDVLWCDGLALGSPTAAAVDDDAAGEKPSRNPAGSRTRQWAWPSTNRFRVDGQKSRIRVRSVPPLAERSSPVQALPGRSSSRK